MGPTFGGEWLWFYSRELHTVVARGKDYSRALDLSTREIHRSRESQTRPTVRAILAFEMAANHFIPPPRLAVVDDGTPEPIKGGFVRLDRKTGQIHLEGIAPPLRPFRPPWPTAGRCSRIAGSNTPSGAGTSWPWSFQAPASGPASASFRPISPAMAATR